MNYFTHVKEELCSIDIWIIAGGMILTGANLKGNRSVELEFWRKKFLSYVQDTISLGLYFSDNFYFFLRLHCVLSLSCWYLLQVPYGVRWPPYFQEVEMFLLRPPAFERHNGINVNRTCDGMRQNFEDHKINIGISLPTCSPSHV